MNGWQRDQMRHIAWPAYLVAFFLVGAPLLDLAVSIWPLHPRTLMWRWGSWALLSKALLVPVLGSLLAVTAASLLDHWRMQLALAVLNGLAAVLLLVGIALFVLDAVQLRGQVIPDAVGSYDVTVFSGLIYSTFALIAFGALSVSAFRVYRATKPKAATAGPPLMSALDRPSPTAAS